MDFCFILQWKSPRNSIAFFSRKFNAAIQPELLSLRNHRQLYNTIVLGRKPRKLLANYIHATPLCSLKSFVQQASSTPHYWVKIFPEYYWINFSMQHNYIR